MLNKLKFWDFLKKDRSFDLRILVLSEVGRLRFLLFVDLLVCKDVSNFREEAKIKI